VAVDGRAVHLRRAGKGPPLLLIHQSPRSSAELEPLIRLLAGEFAVIAPDTPGNGLSEPLGTRAPALAPFADALARLLDVLGIARTAVYGFHTGAAMAAALAARHPTRVTAAVLNGLPAFPPDEVADIRRNYLAPFRPAWDGSHLAWAWARLKEQTIFFPWYAGSPATRMAFDVPSPEALTEGLIEFCRAGDAYTIPYGAAFVDSGPALADAIRCPVAIVATASDPLAAQLGAYVPGERRAVETLQPGVEAAATRIRALVTVAEAGEQRAAPAAEPAGIGLAGAAGAQIAWRRRGSGPERWLWPDLGEDGTVALAAEPAFGRETLMVVDRPGHGASDPAPPEALAAALTDLGHAGPAPAPMWDAERRAAEAQAFGPADAGGGHLLRLWHRARDGFLFQPWHRPTAAAAIAEAAAPAPEEVQLRFLAALVAAPAVRASLRSPNARDR
jgi:pimeloyl-ACP methyl ester carboxylesterase